MILTSGAENPRGLSRCSARDAQTHIPGRAHPQHVLREAVEHRKRLLGEHHADLSCRVAQRNMMPQDKAAVPDQLRLVGCRERHRQLRRFRENAAARDHLAVDVAVGETAETFLQKAVDDRPDVCHVRAVVAACVNDAQIAQHGRARGSEPCVAFAQFNQVAKHFRTARQRCENIVAHQRLGSPLENGEAGDARSQRDCDQDRRADDRDPVVFPRQERRPRPLEPLPGRPQTDCENEQPGGGVHRHTGEKVLGEEQRSADQIARQPKHADCRGPQGQQAHRCAHPRATYAGREDQHRPAHQECACSASRHPARCLTGVMKPRMQRRPIDAEVRS